MRVLFDQKEVALADAVSDSLDGTDYAVDYAAGATDDLERADRNVRAALGKLIEKLAALGLLTPEDISDFLKYPYRAEP
jgi:hypothetical protein